MTEPSKNLISEIHAEQERCRELLGRYAELGAVGTFGYAMIRQGLEAANDAMALGDMVAMIRALKRLRGCK